MTPISWVHECLFAFGVASLLLVLGLLAYGS